MKRLFSIIALVVTVLFVGSVVSAAPALAAPAHFVVASDGSITDWVIPSIPPVVLLVLNFISPYIVSVFTAISWSPNAKKAVALITSFVLSGGTLAIALWVGWVPLDNSPIGIVSLVALGLVLQQVAYKNFVKESATDVQRTVGIGKISRR